MPVIHAHRGASAYAPENTLPAFQKALDFHTEGMETDIHLSLDNVFVVCHDDEIQRTSNGSGSIAQMTVEELKKFDFGVKFSPEFAGTRIPTLDELLELVHGMDILNIEIKGPFRPDTDLRAAFDQLYAQLEKFDCVSRTIISSFGHDWLQLLKECHPDLRTGLLYSNNYTPEETVAMVKRRKADAIHPMLGCLTPKIMAACKENGIEVNVWTVDEPADIKRAIALDPTGIITNVPDRVQAALKSKS